MERKSSILIVEDEEKIRMALRDFLEFHEFKVTEAIDGLEAERSAAKKDFDLILLDLRLPQIDGFRVCERLKTYPETGHIPIVMVTALTATPDRVKGMMYGADEYLTKPVDIKHLDETVSRILGKVYG